MTRVRREVLVSAGIVLVAEGINVGLLFAFPSGHSPFWIPQLPVLMAVALVNPTVGSCPQCAPALFAIAWLAYTTLLCGAAAFFAWVITPRENAEQGGLR